MIGVGPIGRGFGPAPAAGRPREAAPPAVAAAAAVPAGRELVAVAPSAPPAAASRVFRSAAFLAHLIATAEDAPQTRVRRRAGAADAAAAYRAVAALPARDRSDGGYT